MKRIIGIALIFLLMTSLVYGFEETREMSLSADAVSALEIDCGAGLLNVEGLENAAEISVIAEIHIVGVSDRKAQKIMADDLQLYLKKDGDKAVLKSAWDDNNSFFSFFGSDVYVDLTVTLPMNMRLNVDDGSGDAVISNIHQPVKVDDGSGDLNIDRVFGDLKIDDGSGDTRLTDIVGNVTLDDGSGDIFVDKIKGNVAVDDGSGNVKIDGIVGDIYIDDGSGDITIKTIAGNVTVNDSSGSIHIDGVEKDVTIEDDSSGTVVIENVLGQVFQEVD